MRYGLAVALVSVAVISCKEATDPPTATTLAANSSASITAPVGAVVSPSPSVLVKDQRGNPMGGVIVTFTATSGGGSVTGGSATTAANGIATVGAWVLGSLVGPNVLTASSGSLPSVTFTATTTAGPASSLTKVAGDNGSAVVGTALTSAPSVAVKDAFGNPIAGTTVTFAIASGGGSLTNATRTTGADGTATVGSWTLGTAAATNTVTATAGSLAPVTFSATALAGPASRVLAISGSGQTGRAGTLAPTAVAARVTDSFDNAVAGVTVVFAVTQGGGSIIGPATVQTNAQGIAGLSGGWLLGPNAGTNLMTATVAGVGSATFSATGIPNVCVEANHVIGTTTNGVLETTDCVTPDQTFADFYKVEVAAQSMLVFREVTTAVDAYLYVTDGASFHYAEDDDGDAGTNSRIKILAPPMTLHVGPSSYAPGETGAYSLISSAVAESEEQCDYPFIIAGIHTSQNINVTDCTYNPDPSIHADLFLVFIKAGSTIRLRMMSSIIDSYLEIYGGENGSVVASNDNLNATTKDSEITYTATLSGYYLIAARTPTGNQVGAYGLTADLIGSASSVVSTESQRVPMRRTKARSKAPFSIRR